MPALSKLFGGLELIGKGVASHASKLGMDTPLLAAGAVAAATPFAARTAGGILDSIGGGSFRREVNNALEAPVGVATSMRLDRIRRMMMINEARMATLLPHRYSELSIGRRLPRGAVVFGGRPRRDLIEEAAYHMSMLPKELSVLDSPLGSLPQESYDRLGQQAEIAAQNARAQSMLGGF